MSEICILQGEFHLVMYCGDLKDVGEFLTDTLCGHSCGTALGQVTLAQR